MIFMMLAELSGLEIGGVIVAIVVGIVGTVIGIIGLNKKTPVEISPQPLTVEVVEALHEQFAPKKDFERHKERTEAELAELREILRTEIPEMEAKLNAAGEKRIRRIHARLDPLIIGVAQLCTNQGIRMPQQRTTEEDEG